jgi:hypothetical protein
LASQEFSDNRISNNAVTLRLARILEIVKHDQARESEMTNNREPPNSPSRNIADR